VGLRQNDGIRSELRGLEPREIKNTGEIMATNTKRKETRLLARTETLHLSMAGANALFTALENPPKATSKTLNAAQHYKGTVNVRNH